MIEYKARAVLNGAQQLNRNSAIESFSSTVRASTFKLFCAASCIKGRRRFTFDVSGAYLQGKYEDGEVVFARPPPGFRTFDTRGVPIVWKMLRPLYGQADAGRIWQRTINNQFLKQGFERSEYDPCYYYKSYPDGTFMGCCLYVDDGFCDMDVVCPGGDADMKELAAAFDIKVKTDTDYFLGTNVIEHSRTSLTLSARTYIGKLVEKYLGTPLRDHAPTRMPADHTLGTAYTEALERDAMLPKPDAAKYMSLVGALIYAAPCGRPDVAYAVGILARCLTFSTANLMGLAERVIVYLGQHADAGLVYDGTVPGADVLVGYSDSNWTTSHSTSGINVELANASVSYSSKRQQCVALSSCEAELIAASAAACEIVYLRGLLAEMGVPQHAPTVLYVDNQGAVELSKDAKSCHRSRHVLRRFFKVRELVHSGEIVVKWVDTNSNKADLLTKSTFAPATFDKLRGMCMDAKSVSTITFTGLPLYLAAGGATRSIYSMWKKCFINGTSVSD